MKKTFSAFSTPDNPSVSSEQPAPQVRPAIRSLARKLRRLGRWAVILSALLGLFAAHAAHAKLGFMILLPSGLLLIALAGYLVKQIKFLKFKLVGRQAELFAYVLGGCALIGLMQVLIERFILHSS